ncbi:Cell wall synthesis protein kre9 precursor [Cladophialophora chaetospira]|uniref:Cell wall synthesis protein kre9 n=1 Tax=Cladophialophora chaetospira TaxID=386627 RepID=A0AA38XCV6_9EURO|nr:Cell wall synthesis protein kre9 precursor [Cladophialophora chaetospira]
MILRCVCLVAAVLLSFSRADVQVVSPQAGDTITGLNLEIQWKDSGKTPPIAQLANYQLFLCAGGNDESDYIPVATLVSAGTFSTGNTITITLTAATGADVANAYFLKFVSAATGGTVINFSDRFSLASMTGTFPAAVQQGLRGVSGTAGPADQNNIQAPQAGGGAAVPAAGDGVYNTPYTLQSGTIRYAPMPPIAQSTITAKNASPQWPTSAYTVYQTIAGTPNAITTNTNPVTFSVSSVENPVAAAGQPTDGAVQKFLNRWKD